jgi:hypothetical protein
MALLGAPSVIVYTPGGFIVRPTLGRSPPPQTPTGRKLNGAQYLGYYGALGVYPGGSSQHAGK